MVLLKTEKEVFTSDEILKAIADYETKYVPCLDEQWAYYEGKNKKILDRKLENASSPDNKLPVPYGRKIVTTYVGYAHRPRYTTYKANVGEDDEKASIKAELDAKTAAEQGDMTLAMEQEAREAMGPTQAELYVRALQECFNVNNEHIKTSRAGRNIAIFGRSYELLYMDGATIVDENGKTSTQAMPKFMTVDPRELIAYYDYSSEPKIKIAIRFYKLDDKRQKVEVYYPNVVMVYERVREDDTKTWKLVLKETAPNFFGEPPVVAYYFGDDALGVIDPVKPLIDANDVLYSDSMNEFDRFAYAYMIMKKFGLTDMTKVKDPAVADANLKRLKKTRVIEHVPEGADVSFLTKDIPTGFIQFMADRLREQIHVQSHVPDFTSDRLAGASGIAIQRLLFDFENMVSSVEADFDLGLLERIRLITKMFGPAGKPVGTFDDITISHKRNMPLNLQEFAGTANTMKQAGFSRYACADVMPDDVIPDVEVELLRQEEDQKLLAGMNPLDQPFYDEGAPAEDLGPADETAPEDEGVTSGDEGY